MRIYDETQNEWISHRNTAEYQVRKRQLRDYWTIGLIALLPLPAGIQITVIMLGVFVSLSYLDETPYSSDA